jgi:hypothetical protein
MLGLKPEGIIIMERSEVGGQGGGMASYYRVCSGEIGFWRSINMIFFVKDSTFTVLARYCKDETSVQESMKVISGKSKIID